MTIHVTTSPAGGTAHCLHPGCGWQPVGDPDRLRGDTYRHAAQAGHPTTIRLTRTITYQPKPDCHTRDCPDDCTGCDPGHVTQLRELIGGAR